MPTSEFIKTKKQEEATRLMSGKAKHIMLFGGSRSGKTAIIVRNTIIRACKTPSRHISLRKHFNSIKTSLWHETIPKVLSLAFPNLEVKYNKSDYYLLFPNGSEYWIGGLDDDKRAEKILGKEYSTIHFNEVSELSYTSMQMALTRAAEKNNLSKKIYYDQNPPAKAHWSYWQFIKKLNPVDNEPLIHPENYQYLQMNPGDNIQNLDPDYLSMLQSLPEREQKRFLLGEFTDSDEGQVYYAFKRDEHVKECEFDNGTKLIGFDFNINPLTAVIGQYIDDKFYIIDEMFLQNSDTFKACDYLKAKKYHGNVYPDSTGRNRKTSGMSDFDILDQNGFKIMPVRNPMVIDRTNNMNRLFSANRIIIHPRCKKLINDLEKVSWKDGKLDQKTDSMLTHISDALGYLTWAIDPFMGLQKSRTVQL